MKALMSTKHLTPLLPGMKSLNSLVPTPGLSAAPCGSNCGSSLATSFFYTLIKDQLMQHFWRQERRWGGGGTKKKKQKKGLLLRKTFWLFCIVLEDFAVCRHPLLSNRLIAAGESMLSEQRAARTMLHVPIQEMLLGSYRSSNYGFLDAVNYSRENSEHRTSFPYSLHLLPLKGNKKGKGKGNAEGLTIDQQRRKHPECDYPKLRGCF